MSHLASFCFIFYNKSRLLCTKNTVRIFSTQTASPGDHKPYFFVEINFGKIKKKEIDNHTKKEANLED